MLLAVHISSYGCTRKVWRARKKRKSCPRLGMNQFLSYLHARLTTLIICMLPNSAYVLSKPLFSSFSKYLKLCCLLVTKLLRLKMANLSDLVGFASTLTTLRNKKESRVESSFSTAAKLQNTRPRLREKKNSCSRSPALNKYLHLGTKEKLTSVRFEHKLNRDVVQWSSMAMNTR